MTPTTGLGTGPFLSAEQAALVRERFGTPCYVYDRAPSKRRRARRSPSPPPSGSPCGTR